MNDVKVVFEPYGKRVKASVGELVFSIAEKAGVVIRSECGGRGVCGKCKVIVLDQNAISKLSDIEMKRLTSSEIIGGYRLACQTRVLKNVVVAVPPESIMRQPKLMILGFERDVKLSPVVSKLHLLLPKPTLSDIRPDFERLLESAQEQFKDFGGLDIDYNVLKMLPEILRRSRWDITLVIWNRRIIGVEPGDTSDRIFGLALDIGTSKIVGHLVDLKSGRTIAVASIENPQAVYGEDIITRITHASRDDANLKELQRLAVDGVNKVLREVCVNAGVDPFNVYEVMIVGNTAMHHFFFGIQPKYLARSPYVPALRKTVSVKAKDLGVNAYPCSIVTSLPMVAGFVGADAVADVIATGMHELGENSILIDIGTNTEVFVGNRDILLCCSCASGPAFEGAHIKHGMKAVTGAIEKVHIDNNFDVEYETIGGVKPLGICGSAVIDVIAEMFKHGIVDANGRINSEIESPRIRACDEGLEFVIAWKDETATGREITLTQKDIREVQLAKAAIYSACSILMRKRGLSEEKIDFLFIAGAFGNYINPENAKVIGLIPDVPSEKIRFVGNTAVAGAKMALISKEIRYAAEQLVEKIRYLELAANPDFNQEFINALNIPHRFIGRFPSVTKHIKSFG
ncbi:MAG: ASKHA domain-containing protein [Candidatus Bathyarchaeia archaeon]